MWRTLGLSCASLRKGWTCVDRRRGDKGGLAVDERWRAAGLCTVVPSSREGRAGRVERGRVLHGGRTQGHRISAGFPEAIPHFSTPHPQPEDELRVPEPPSSARPERRFTGGPHSTRFGGARKRAKRLRGSEKRQLWGDPQDLGLAPLGGPKGALERALTETLKEPREEVGRRRLALKEARDFGHRVEDGGVVSPAEESADLF